MSEIKATYQIATFAKTVKNASSETIIRTLELNATTSFFQNTPLEVFAGREVTEVRVNSATLQMNTYPKFDTWRAFVEITIDYVAHDEDAIIDDMADFFAAQKVGAW